VTERRTPSAGWVYHACGLGEVGADDGWLSTAEAERLAAFRFEKRRSETRMGRWTAKCAVGRFLGLPVDDWITGRSEQLSRIGIRNEPGGAPRAYVDDQPAGVSISMTDRADWAVCVVAGNPTVSVGCDLELVEHRSAAFVADWFTAPEREMLALADPSEHDLLANLVWSAKESALKVLGTGLRRDTRSVEVRLGTSELDGWRSLEVRSLDATDAVSTFPGWWRRFGEFVLTCSAEAALDPPTPATQPPPLESASPSHAWAAELCDR
jgi:4'-phosphopantetheinyl transferase